MANLKERPLKVKSDKDFNARNLERMLEHYDSVLRILDSDKLQLDDDGNLVFDGDIICNSGRFNPESIYLGTVKLSAPGDSDDAYVMQYDLANNRIKFASKSSILTLHANAHSSGGEDEVSHDDLKDSHNLTTDIDHDQITNTHQDVGAGASPTFSGLTIGGLNIDSDGQITLTGNARYYKDIQFPIASGKVPAANFPTYEAFTTNLRAYSFAVNDYIDLDTAEVLHSWEEGSTVEFHAHATTKAANTSGADRFVKLTLYVGYCGTSGVWTETSLSAELTIPNGTAAKTLFYLDIGNLDLTGFAIGTELKLMVKRIAATGGTEYSGNIFLTQVGAHLINDRLGSANEDSQ